MATIFQRIFNRLKENSPGPGNNSTTSVDQSSQSANTTAVSSTGNNSTTSVNQSSQPATTTAVPSTTSTSSFSNTLTKDNSLDEIINQMKNLDTSVDTSAQQNFDVNKYLGGVKQGLQNLNGGQIQQSDISKFTSMRPENPYEAGIGRGLDKIEQFTDPNSDVYKTMFNRALDRFDATAAATNMSQAMRIANNPNLSDSAKRVALAELNRVTQSNRAALTGDLTEQVNKMMFDAAKEFTTQSINAADYEEGKFKTDAGLALQEMSNRIQTLQLEGQLSITEAQIAYNQINDTINNKYKDVANQLEKLSLLATTAEKSQDYKLRAEQVYAQMFDFWGEKSVNRIIELKKLNGGTVTLDQVKNDPLTMSYLMKEMEISGYEGNVDDYIQSRIDLAKTQVQIDQEAVDALIQTYMNSGMDEETATTFARYYSQLKNGAIQNEDGSWYVPGADGKPLITFKDGKPIFEDANKDDSGADIPTEVGKTYTLEGKLYQVGEDGKGVEIQNGAYYVEGDIVYVNNNGVPTKATTPSDLWGADANSIIGLGEGTKMYDEIMNKRKEKILEGTYNYKQLKADPEKMSLAKKVATPVDTGTKPLADRKRDRKREFTSVPEKNVPFTYNGKTYISVGDVDEEKVRGSGYDYQYYHAIDLDTGDVVRVACEAGLFTIDGVGPQASTKTETPTESNTVEDDSTTGNSSTTRPRGRSLTI